MSKNPRLRLFWWVILIVCTVSGVGTTTLVIREYLSGQTATSTTIKLVSSLELPAITICPKTSDLFNFPLIYSDMKEMIPDVDNHTATDVLRFFLGGSGFENIEQLKSFNRSYLDKLNQMYVTWKNGYNRREFFDTIVVSSFFTHCNKVPIRVYENSRRIGIVLHEFT